MAKNSKVERKTMKRSLKFLLLAAMLMTLATTAFCQTANDYVSSGLDKWLKNDFDGAIADYNKAIALQPDDEDAYVRRTQAEQSKGDWDSAIADATKAIELKPDDEYAYSLRGEAKRAKGDLDGAIADCTKVIEINPKLDAAYYNRGILKKDKGDYDGAIADFTYVIQLYPDDQDNYDARGDAKTDKRDYDGAIADYNKAIELAPKDANAYNGRGVAEYFKGNLDGAIADYTKSMELDQDNYQDPSATAYENRGLARRDKGDLDGAIADYSKVIELKPDDPQAYWSRGCLRYDSHDFTNALADFRLLTGDGSAIRIWLIRARTGEMASATTDLQTYLTNRTTGKPDDWDSQIGHFLTGQLTEDQFLAAAAKVDPQTDGALCQAYFYAGSKHLISGDKVTAKDDFQKSIATNQKYYEEYFSAAAELKLLEAEKN